MKDKALEYLNRDFLLNVDIIESINRGLCELVYAEDDGVLVRMDGGDVWLISMDDAEKAAKLVSEHSPTVLVLHQMELKPVFAELGYEFGRECRQVVYGKSEPLPVGDFDIRPLTKEYAELASSVYHMGDIEYMNELIDGGDMVAAYDGDKLMGFMGLHSEGAMGLLEVLPEYRRQGLASALECFVIDRCLQRGELPYAQIFADNDASLALQAKLGLDISKNHICWIWND